MERCGMLLSLVLGLIGVVSIDSALAQAQKATPDPLLAVDQNRTTVIDRIVSDWGDNLAVEAGVNQAQLREMLFAMRADQLLAASLVGSLDGLKAIFVAALRTTANGGARVAMAADAPSALGDTNADLVYTPVTPCRLFDTRPSQGGLGTPTLNVRRTYGAITPVANQGGPGGCAAAAGAAVALIQIGTLTPSGNGLLQAGPQGAASFPNALILYQPGDQYGTAVAMPLNPANGQFDLVEQFATADLYADLQGYFRRPVNYGGTHVITGLYATDSGGFSNTASGQNSTVAGGIDNRAIGGSSTVLGGEQNTASGAASTVAGGKGNTASGILSFAAGLDAKANFDGCFVWGDRSTFDEVRCDAQDRFVVRATGGIFMLAGGTNQTNYTGVVLPPGAQAWIAASDRAGKNNVEPIDAKAILRKVAALPITTWTWTTQDPSIRHMGPMAQDFHLAFGLGESPKGISTIDADGVALAAIQGLDAKVDSAIREKDRQLAAQAATIHEQQRQLAGLSDRVQKAESLAANVVALRTALAELQRTRASVAVK